MIKITFGIIVLNGEPFLRYNLRSLYPFAHQIIVVEGASPAAFAASTPDGHSTDDTRRTLLDFKQEEDPENKLTIVTAEDEGHQNGFWPGEKDEQSQAYAKRATGDYLWQVDIDEFYHPDDINKILDILQNDPSISQINVPWLNFWGDFNYIVDGLFLQKHYRDLGGGVPRIFQWGPGYSYVKHRPPTVIDANGRDVRKGTWLKGTDLAMKGIYCYHYATIFAELIEKKILYYEKMNWDGLGNFIDWYHDNFLSLKHPFNIHHVTTEISWLESFSGKHPPHIIEMINDMKEQTLTLTRRDNKEIDRLLESKRYRIGRYILKKYIHHLIVLRKLFPVLERSGERLFKAIFSPH